MRLTMDLSATMRATPFAAASFSKSLILGVSTIVLATLSGRSTLALAAEAPTAASSSASTPVAPSASDFSPALSKGINDPTSAEAKALPKNGKSRSADGTQTAVKMKTTGGLNKQFTDTSEITDARIRADAGSMSRYSAKLSLSFYGPPAGDLSSDRQPNPDGTIGNYNTALGGSVGLRYRIDPTRTISFGTGVNVLTPFQQINRVDVRTPYVSFDKTYRIGEWQMRHSPGMSIVTTPEYLQVGEVGALSYDASVYRGIGHSRFSAGLDTSLGYFLYKREYVNKDRTAAQYNWGFFPTLKFRANDKVGVYTSVALNYYNPRKLHDQSVWEYRTVSERLGFEYSFNRDIYIAPYLNFFPQSLSINSTTINLNTVISIL